MKKADAGRHQPFSYSYEEENKLRCLGSLTIGNQCLSMTIIYKIHIIFSIKTRLINYKENIKSD